MTRDDRDGIDPSHGAQHAARVALGLDDEDQPPAPPVRLVMAALLFAVVAGAGAGAMVAWAGLI